MKSITLFVLLTIGRTLRVCEVFGYPCATNRHCTMKDNFQFLSNWMECDRGDWQVVWLKIEKKTVTTVRFHSGLKEREIDFSECAWSELWFFYLQVKCGGIWQFLHMEREKFIFAGHKFFFSIEIELFLIYLNEILTIHSSEFT